MALMDLHLHTHTSFDCRPTSTLKGACDAALRAGVGVLALTNHYELDGVLAGQIRSPDHEQEERELLESRRIFAGKLEILRGIELGQPYASPAETERLLSARPYDVVLGSVHHLSNGVDFYDVRNKDLPDGTLREMWRDYLSLLYTVASETPVDVQTHICYPLRYLPTEKRREITGLPGGEREQFTPIFRKLAERGLALEINTAALRNPAANLPVPDPGLELLKLYRELGGEFLTLGSDAHVPGDVGTGLREGARLAEAAGFRYLTVFRERKPYPILISEVLS